MPGPGAKPAYQTVCTEHCGGAKDRMPSLVGRLGRNVTLGGGWRRRVRSATCRRTVLVAVPMTASHQLAQPKVLQLGGLGFEGWTLNVER